MVESLSSAILREGGSAAQRFARWDGAVFAEWAYGPVAEVWAMDGARGQDLLRLVVEGTGLGVLGSLGQRPKSWLDGLLRSAAPAWLAATPPEERAALLAQIWNLGEGARREAAWMDRYLLARLSVLRGPATLQADVARELEPLLDPAPPCPWSGPYAVSTLDLRATDDKFLPGKLAFMGPRILAVADRRRDTVLGLLLGPGAPSVLGPLDAVEVPPDNAVLPDLYWEEGPAWEEGQVCIGQSKVTLPHVGEPLALAIGPAGYVVATAENSQRLWIVAHG